MTLRPRCWIRHGECALHSPYRPLSIGPKRGVRILIKSVDFLRNYRKSVDILGNPKQEPREGMGERKFSTGVYWTARPCSEVETARWDRRALWPLSSGFPAASASSPGTGRVAKKELAIPRSYSDFAGLSKISASF